MKFPFILTVLVLLCLPTTLLRAQESQLEVYYQALEESQGSEKVDILLNIVQQLRTINQQKALSTAKDALKLAKQINYTNGQISSSYSVGILERDRGKYNRALSVTKDGLALAKRKRDVQEMIMGNKLMQTIYMLKQDPANAKIYQNAFKQIRDSIAGQELAKKVDRLQEKYTIEKGNTKAAIRAGKNREASLQEDLMAEENRRIQQEMEIMKLERESAELEREVMEKEKVAMENMMKLNKKIADEEKAKNQRNLAIGGVIILLMSLFGIFLWYRIRQQRRKAHVEMESRIKMEQIDQLKDQFLANTSHELRTPLNGIIGLAEALEEKASNDFQQENLSMIISSARRLASLVDDILDFSRLRNQEVRLQSKAIDPYALVGMILKLNQPLANKKQITLINKIDPNCPAIQGDENRLQQILHNLIGNAIKFTHKGVIEVTTTEVDGKLHISVADSGIGIAAEKQKGIFQEFSQADGSISRTYSGSGLGLSISKKLVELHDGDLWVESEEGKGSIFTFSIPLSWEKSVLTEASPAKVSHLVQVEDLQAVKTRGAKISDPTLTAKNGKGNFKILIVDDEPVNQQVFQNHFMDQPFEMTVAMNGEEAMEFIQSGSNFDLVLLDIMMPRMTGYDVCKLIREQYSSTQLPVIMVTAKNQVQDLVEGLATGANDYLAKPFSKDELLARVKTHLNLYSINSATSRFVPYQFLRALGKETITEVRLGDYVAKEVSVLFSDIRRYTSLSEQMTPEQNFRFVNSYAGRMGPVIQANGGFINQYMGDGIMAIFQQSPEHAIQAGIDMQRAIRKYNAERIQANRTPIEVGMGIQTGPLVMGIIGDALRTEPATISDTVNLASRMEGLTKYYGSRLLVSEDTLNCLKNPDAFPHRYLGEVKVKGKEQAIGVYEFFDLEECPLDVPKWENRELFSSALQIYNQLDFARASKLFEEIIQQNTMDKAAEYYLKKANQYLREGPPEAWNGVETMVMK